MDGGSGLPQGLRPFHGRLYKGLGEPRRGTKKTTTLAATPPPGRAAGPSSPPPGAPPCTCASLGGTTPAAVGGTIREIGSRDSVHGIDTRDSRSIRQCASPTLLPLS